MILWIMCALCVFLLVCLFVRLVFALSLIFLLVGFVCLCVRAVFVWYHQHLFEFEIICSISIISCLISINIFVLYCQDIDLSWCESIIVIDLSRGWSLKWLSSLWCYYKCYVFCYCCVCVELDVWIEYVLHSD